MKYNDVKLKLDSVFLMKVRRVLNQLLGEEQGQERYAELCKRSSEAFQLELKCNNSDIRRVNAARRQANSVFSRELINLGVRIDDV